MTTGHKDPLHGITLEAIVTTLVARHGWPALAKWIPIRCFENDPTVKSSLTFLRRTPWARTKVEELYLKGPPPAGPRRGRGFRGAPRGPAKPSQS